MEPGRRAEIVVDGGEADAAQNAARAESIRGTAADDTQHTGDFDPFDAEGDDYDETATDESWNRGRGGPDRSGLLPAPPVPGAGIPLRCDTKGLRPLIPPQCTSTELGARPRPEFSGDVGGAAAAALRRRNQTTSSRPRSP